MQHITITVTIDAKDQASEQLSEQQDAHPPLTCEFAHNEGPWYHFRRCVCRVSYCGGHKIEDMNLSKEEPGASREAANEGPSVAAGGSEPVPGWSAMARAAMELWDAHPATIETKARGWAWSEVLPEEAGSLNADFIDRIADAAVLGVRALIGTWAHAADGPVTAEIHCATCGAPEDHEASGGLCPAFAEPQPSARTSTMCVCGQNQELAPPGWGNLFKPHIDPKTGQLCPVGRMDGCICNRQEGQPGYGLLCPIHGDPISHKNVAEQTLPELLQEMRATQAAIVEQIVAEPGPSIKRGGMQWRQPHPGEQEAFRIAQGDLERDTPEEAVQKMRDHAATAPRDEDGRFSSEPPVGAVIIDRYSLAWQRDKDDNWGNAWASNKLWAELNTAEYWPIVVLASGVQTGGGKIWNDLHILADEDRRMDQVYVLAVTVHHCPSYPQPYEHDGHAWVNSEWQAWWCPGTTGD